MTELDKAISEANLTNDYVVPFTWFLSTESLDNHLSAAKLCHMIMKDSFKYCPTQELFYVFNEKKKLWITMKDIRTEIRQIMEIKIEEVSKAYFKKQKENLLEAVEDFTEDDDIDLEEEEKQFKKMTNKMIELFNRFKSSVKNVDYRSKIHRELQKLLADDTFRSKLNQNKDIISVKNGVVDLKTGSLKQRTKQHYLTHQLDIEYKPSSTNEIWEKFVREIMCEDLEMIEFMQRTLGYSITGHTSEQVFIVWYGLGANGKSVLMNCMEKVVRELFHKANKELIIESAKTTANSHSSHLKSLIGKRVVVVDETREDEGLNDAVIKSLTGSSTITCRGCYDRNELTFEPEFTIFLGSNYKPKILADYAMTRRVVLVPFSAQFKPNPNDEHEYSIDYNIEDKMMKNREGILSWLVEGAKAWYQNGLSEKPQKVITASKEYLYENDEIQQFLDERIEKEANGFVKLTELFEEFRSFQPDSRMKRKAFIQHMKIKGYIYGKNKNRGPERDKMGFFGIAIIEDKDEG